MKDKTKKKAVWYISIVIGCQGMFAVPHETYLKIRATTWGGEKIIMRASIKNVKIAESSFFGVLYKRGINAGNTRGFSEGQSIRIPSSPVTVGYTHRKKSDKHEAIDVSGLMNSNQLRRRKKRLPGIFSS